MTKKEKLSTLIIVFKYFGNPPIKTEFDISYSATVEFNKQYGVIMDFIYASSKHKNLYANKKIKLLDKKYDK